MGCTKSQILALLLSLRKSVESCKDFDCAMSIINYYISIVEEKSLEELKYELGLP